MRKWYGQEVIPEKGDQYSPWVLTREGFPEEEPAEDEQLLTN